MTTAREISVPWDIWSCAGESALIDAFRVSGDPIPAKGFVRCRGVARFKNACVGGATG